MIVLVEEVEEEMFTEVLSQEETNKQGAIRFCLFAIPDLQSIAMDYFKYMLQFNALPLRISFSLH